MKSSSIILCVVLGLHSGAGNDLPSSKGKDQVVRLSESPESRRRKERLAQVFPQQIHPGKN